MRANLVSLQQTNSMLELTQKRLSTGKKVNSALDDPVAYFTAVAHEQRAADLSTRKDEMSEAVQTIKAANAGIESINSLIASAKSLATASLSAEDPTDLIAQYGEVIAQIDAMALDSGYKGVNLLNDEDLTVKFSPDAELTVAGSLADSATLGIVDLAADNADAVIDSLDAAKASLQTLSSTLSSNLGIITSRQEFTQGMINVLKDGAANLTNADMNEDGANMLMLQTRQALGTTSLSLASQAAQSVLRLF
jgi:flagellin-like hook-associated protein FlgL